MFYIKMNKFIFTYLSVFVLCFINIKGVPNYTDKEKAALTEFRKMMNDTLYKDYMKSDPYLVRWIRAQDFDLNKASKMLRTALKWRKENKIDDILKQNIYQFQIPPFYFAGVDREGSPVLLGFASKVDVRGLLLTGKRAVLLRYVDQLLELGETAVLELLGVHPPGYTFSNIDPSLKFVGNDSLFKLVNTESDKTTGILDMQGYNLRQHACLACLSSYLEGVHHYENYYTGYLKRTIVINAPRIAKPVIDFITPLVSPFHRSILEIYGPDRNEWIPALHKIISPSEFTKHLFGTKSD